MLIVVRSHDFKYKKKWFWFKCLQRWDEVDIQEETEDGKKIKSKIQVPMQVIICSYKEGKLYSNLAATLQIWTFNLFLRVSGNILTYVCITSFLYNMITYYM
jgi:hypothetical protein